MSASRTELAKLAIGTTGTVDVPLNFLDFDPGVRRELRDTNGVRGTFDQDSNRVRENRRTVSPRFRSEPTAAELAAILQWATGGTPTGSGTVAYPLGNAAPTRYVHWAPEQGDQFLLSGVAVDNATVRAASGEPLAVDLDLVGQDYDDAPAAFPALSVDQTTQPFILTDLVLSVGGVARSVREFSFTVANNIDRGRFFNSLTLTAVNKLRRQLRVTVDVPSGDNPGLWKAGVAGAALVATFTNPANSAVFVVSCPSVKFPAQSPSHPFGGEGMVRVEGSLYRVGTGSPVAITLNQGS